MLHMILWEITRTYAVSVFCNGVWCVRDHLPMTSALQGVLMVVQMVLLDELSFTTCVWRAAGLFWVLEIAYRWDWLYLTGYHQTGWVIQWRWWWDITISGACSNMAKEILDLGANNRLWNRVEASGLVRKSSTGRIILLKEIYDLL